MVFKKFAKYMLILFLSKKTKSKIDFRSNFNFKTYLEGSNVIHKNVSLSNSKIGFATYVGKDSYLVNTSIGRYCSIAENVKIVFGSHPSKVFISTHPAFFSTKKQAGFTFVKEELFRENKFADEEEIYSVVIGNDVWIGSDVTVLEGVTIGDGAIIATGAVVVKDLEPYTIYGGVPAKKIGERFSSAEQKFLTEFQWWSKSFEWLEEHAYLFSDINKLIDHFKKNKKEEG
ncbi:CatB-related O-acetyltransferase [Planococcus shixiaomingii]|uniref:CatB-related O-acetyltransferase n=1 Tax=Planococcus shixiaomingii TaxID=3058393 RepID=UPI0026164997|nr:CatB-related O-acetyltransferase [Planococcus sp. N022]WKA53998.1 CatB-related O-acetyltransferase [Planococcus sp. N022]